MAVIYTDSKGMGYDPDQLRSAYGSGAFANDPTAGRVPDILAQYPTTSTAAAPTPKVNNAFPGTQNLTIPSSSVSTPGGTGSEATTQQAPAFTPANVASPIDANTIIGFYQKYLNGRMPSAEELTAASGHPGGAPALEQFIANSDEAKGYAVAGAGRTAVHNPAVVQGPGTGTGANDPSTLYGNDPNASLLINTILSRLKQLQQPVDTTAQDAYAKQALDRVQQLSAPPYTDAQSQALITQMRDPLTQARDQAKQQAAEQLSRRGITPTSGVFVDTMNKIDQAYQRGIASGTNSLAVKGIDQQQTNAMQQLQLLNSIVEMNKATHATQEGQSSQLIPTAANLTNFDSSRLNTLLNASSTGGGDPTSLIAALNNLGQLGIQQQGVTNSANSANAYALAQMVYALMQGTGGLIH